jgi:hypothetical protein
MFFDECHFGYITKLAKKIELCTVQKQMIAIKENVGEGLILRSFSELTLGWLSSFSERTCDVLPICRM